MENKRELPWPWCRRLQAAKLEGLQSFSSCWQETKKPVPVTESHSSVNVAGGGGVRGARQKG